MVSTNLNSKNHISLQPGCKIVIANNCNNALTSYNSIYNSYLNRFQHHLFLEGLSSRKKYRTFLSYLTTPCIMITVAYLSFLGRYGSHVISCCPVCWERKKKLGWALSVRVCACAWACFGRRRWACIMCSCNVSW